MPFALYFLFGSILRRINISSALTHRSYFLFRFICESAYGRTKSVNNLESSRKVYTRLLLRT